MQEWLLKAIKKERDNPTPPNFNKVGSYSENFTLKAWDERDIEKIFLYMPNTHWLGFVFDNSIRLLVMGKYEESLLHAYTATRTNWAHWHFENIKWLFSIADPVKLRAAGDPIPARDQFILYRGVNGKTRARRINGYSWTSSLKKAIWFAKRFSILFKDPGVYQVTVQEKNILAAINDRKEHEYLLKLPLPVKPKRVSVDFIDGDH